MYVGWTLVMMLAMLMGTPASAITPAATLRFATSCADCHEGECSRRLSFARNPRAAFEHIRRYAGPTDDELAHQLYDALEKMKSDCSYPPLTVPDLTREMDARVLDAYRDPWSGDYFLPLTGLRPGRYGLAITFDGSGKVRIEVIDSGFDPIFDECLTVEDKRLGVTLPAGDRGHAYLRLRLEGGLRVQRLRFEPVE